jgi:hypothetical protein
MPRRYDSLTLEDARRGWTLLSSTAAAGAPLNALTKRRAA